MLKFRLISLLIMSITGAGALAQNNALGIAFNGDLYKVDVTTGVGALVGNTGLTNPNCMAAYNGIWYTVDNIGQLVRVSPTGTTSVVYTLSLGGATDVRGLAFDANSVMYAVVNATPEDQLWQINPSTGVGGLVGTMNSSTIQGLAFGFNGKLYAYDVLPAATGGLREVNRATGATTDLDAAAFGSGNIQDIFPSGASLLGGRDSLYNIAQTTGLEVLIGTGGYSDVRGWARKQSVMQLNVPTVKLGQLISGNATSMRFRDGDIYAVNKFIVPNQQVDPINVEVTYAMSLNHAAALDTGFMWYGRATTSGAFNLNVDAFNTATGGWDNFGTRVINSTMNEYVFSHVGSMANYFSNNVMTVRFRVKPTGPVGSATWGIQLDMFRVEEIENF